LIAKLKEAEHDVILVSSGAVAAGYSQLKLDRNSVGNRQALAGNRQALAAIGQPLLMKMYQEKFARYGLLCSQILLSADVFDSRRATAHAKEAVDTLLANHVVPIINENDTVSIDELVFGDNDRLSASTTKIPTVMPMLNREQWLPISVKPSFVQSIRPATNLQPVAL